MNLDEAKEEVKSRWKEFYPKSEDKKGIICPICGHGAHGDGIIINKKSSDKYALKCFGSCGFSGDIINLYMQDKGLDYIEAMKTMCNELRIIIDDTPRTTPAPAKKAEIKEEVKGQVQNMEGLFLKAKENINKTDYLQNRGISEEVADRFNIGYVEKFKIFNKDGKEETWKALIIPTGTGSYTVRNTDTLAKEGNRYRKKGTASIFNKIALKEAVKPIYVVEGELDALSIIEAGGEALAIGSISYISTFEKALDEQPPTQPLIIALDNDEPGEKATKELEEAIKKRGIEYYIINPCSGYKDANENLIMDREAFIKQINITYASIQEENEERENKEKNDYLRTSTDNYLQDFIDSIAKESTGAVIKTGFNELDKVLEGGLYSGLYIIGAISSLGKTTYTLQIADQIAQQGTDVIIFSLEMARRELIAKSVSRNTLINVASNNLDKGLAKTTRGILTGERYKNYSAKEMQIIQESIEAYKGYANHIFIYEGVGDIGATKIREEVEKHFLLTGRKPVVFIDYLQILAPYNDRATDKQNTDKAVLELKRLSRDLDLAVFAVSSLNRASYKEAISMEAFKESGAIEYSADVLIGLQLAGADSKDFNVNEAKAKTPREIEAIILKQRNGKTGSKVTYKYDPMFNSFTEEGTAVYTRIKSKNII